MKTPNVHERDALVRMMIYLKYELIRNNCSEEAESISDAIKKMESRFSFIVDHKI